MYCPGNATRSGDQAPVGANGKHVLVSVSEWTQVSLVNTTNAYDEDEHALAPEERWKPADDIGRPSCLPAADHHHQNLADEREHVPPWEEVAQRRLQSKINSSAGLVWKANVIQSPQYHAQRAVLVETHAQVRAAAVGGDTYVRLMLADRETPRDRLDEGFLKVEVSTTNVARAVDQERNISGNRDVGYSCIFHNTR